MSRIFIINGHQPYPFAQGRLNQSLVEVMDKYFQDRGDEVRHSSVLEYRIDEEVEKHLWADVIILQSPVYWMGLPWKAKKYVDEVYSAGIMGKFCLGDGRTSEAPKKNYGGGGLLKGKKSMLSLTFNAPREAFNDVDEYLFGGKCVS